MKFELVKVKDFFDVQWGDTNKTKSSYVSEGYLAYSASGPDGCLDTYDYDCDGVVLSAIGANCGVTYFAKGKWSCIKNTMRILPKPELSDATYFYYLSKTRNFWPKRGSAQPFISQTDVRELEIQLPSLGIQRAIGRALRQIDDKIAVNSAMSSNLEKIAQTIFKSWFVDFDPVHAKARGEQPEGMNEETAALFPHSFEDSELGRIPSGWKLGKVQDLVGLVKDTVKAGPTTLNRPYVPIDVIRSKTLLLHDVAPSEEAKTSLLSFEHGDVLFGAMRPYFHKVCIAPFNGTTRSTNFVLRPKAHKSFSALYLSMDATVDFATKHSQGSTIPYAVWANGLAEMDVVMPSTPVLDTFEAVARPLFDLGEELIRQNKVLAEIRDALLPVLISGELQIPDELLGE